MQALRFFPHECWHTWQHTPLSRGPKLLWFAHAHTKRLPMGLSSCITVQPTSLLNRNSYNGVNILITVQLLQLVCSTSFSCAVIPEYAHPAVPSWLMSNEKVQCLVRRTALRGPYWRHNCINLTAFDFYALSGLQRGEFTALLQNTAC